MNFLHPQTSKYLLPAYTLHIHTILPPSPYQRLNLLAFSDKAMTSCAPLSYLGKLSNAISQISLQHEDNLQNNKLQETRTEYARMYKTPSLMFLLSQPSAIQDITKEVRKYSFTASYVSLYFVAKPHICPDSAVRKQSSWGFLIAQSCYHSRGGFSARAQLQAQPPFARESC